MNDYEQSRSTFEALANTVKNFDENEATTRHQLIDHTLIDCLGWPREQIQCEKYHQGDYLDYVLGNPEGQAVLEAKRSSNTFDAPAGVKSGIISLSVIRDYSKTNASAIDQAMQYCQKSGIAIAILSNGNQYLAFLGSRADGKPPTAGDAAFFSSLLDASADFANFWNCLSREGISRGDLISILQRSTHIPLAPPPMSSRIVDYPGYRIGSPMETDLRILGDLFIQDITKVEAITDDFLRECYCPSGALSQYATVSKEIMRSRYMSLQNQVNTEDATNKKGLSENLKKDILAGALVRRPIVLLGDVGVGKSMFLRHLFRVDKDQLVDNSTVIYVDFLNHSGLTDDVPGYLVDAIRTTLEDILDVDIIEGEFVRSVYNREINQFKRGVYGFLESDDPPEFRKREAEMLATHLERIYNHAKRSIEFLQGTRRLAFVIALDNVDQHQPIFQEQIFMTGQSLAETWPVTVFMSLRPDTFHLSRKRGALAAYQPRVFTVSPPRADQVILKRLEFARSQLSEFGRLPGFPQGFTLNSESLLVYIDVLIAAFESNDKLIALVDNLSSGNIRRALDFISTFVGSGYVQTQRILEADKRGDRYVVPIHEFMRAIIYGDYKYYDPRQSTVPNLFEIEDSDKKEHFLSPLILSTVEATGEREQGGYASTAEIYSQLQSLGYSGAQINRHAALLVESGCLEQADHGTTDSLIRITRSGSYLHKSLISEFSYVDAVVVDTPILDVSARAVIEDVFDIQHRVVRAEAFDDYLRSCWPFSAIHDLTFDWLRKSETLRQNLYQVKAGADRARIRRERSRE